MAGQYHSGEIAVQTRAGVRAMSERVAGGIRPYAALPAQTFLAEQPFVLLGAADEAGRIWATPLWGEAGFAHFSDARTVHIATTLLPDDPLAAALRRETAVGLLAIEPETRRRMRVNGNAWQGETEITLATEQVYANCPQYITARTLDSAILSDASFAAPTHCAAWGERLTATQCAFIEAADTFFIASAHPDGGADVSHRGGPAGFIHTSVEGETLVFPDYRGNTMFQTLGNITATGKAGLLFLDWRNGDLLHLSGEARILWDDAKQEQFPGAERLVEFSVRAVLSRPGIFPLRAEGATPSPFNPR